MLLFDQGPADSTLNPIIGLNAEAGPPSLRWSGFASSAPQAALDPAKVLNDRSPPSAAELSISSGVTAIGVSMRQPQSRNPEPAVEVMSCRTACVVFLSSRMIGRPPVSLAVAWVTLGMMSQSRLT